jgi:hypothetical protein
MLGFAFHFALTLSFQAIAPWGQSQRTWRNHGKLLFPAARALKTQQALTIPIKGINQFQGSKP